MFLLFTLQKNPSGTITFLNDKSNFFKRIILRIPSVQNQKSFHKEGKKYFFVYIYIYIYIPIL